MSAWTECRLRAMLVGTIKTRSARKETVLSPKLHGSERHRAIQHFVTPVLVKATLYGLDFDGCTGSTQLEILLHHDLIGPIAIHR